MKTIVTHSGSFHTDDIFAVATIQLAFPKEEFTVVRTRDEEKISHADIVVDVGGIHNPSTFRFDHHQTGAAGYRENGIPYASFGLVWKEFGEGICGSKEVAEMIDQKLVQPVDAMDNGVVISTPTYPGVFQYSINSFLMSYKKENEIKEEELYKTFIELVGVTKALLEREIQNEKIASELRQRVRDLYNVSERKDVLILDTSIGRHIWKKVSDEFPELLYVVSLDVSGDKWKADAVPVTNDSFDCRKRFPASWAGKLGTELAEVTGVPGSIFCHNARFLAVAKTKEDILALIELALAS